MLDKARASGQIHGCQFENALVYINRLARLTPRTVGARYHHEFRSRILDAILFHKQFAHILVQRQIGGGVLQGKQDFLHGGMRLALIFQIVNGGERLDDLAAACLGDNFGNRYWRFTLLGSRQLLAGACQLGTPVGPQQQVGDVDAHLALLLWVGLLALSFDQGFVKLAQGVGYFFRHQHCVCNAQAFNVFHRCFFQTLHLAVDTAQQQMRGQAVFRKFDSALQVVDRHIEGFHLVMQVAQVEICRGMAQPGFNSTLQFAGGLGIRFLGLLINHLSQME